MVAGHSGAGKSDFLATLVESLDIINFHPVENSSDIVNPLPVALSAPTAATARMECKDVFGARVLIHLTDTPGFIATANLNPVPAKTYSDMILQYIEKQFAATLANEIKVDRDPRTIDVNVHACLYFIHPDTALRESGLTEMDMHVLKALCKRVNVIPVIAHADSLTVTQHRSILQKLQDQLANSKLGLYDLNDDEQDLNAQLPLFLVNSEHSPPGLSTRMGIERCGNIILGRHYSFGFVETLNPKHSQFALLKECLLSSHLEDLKDATKDVMYENWRAENLSAKLDNISGDSAQDMRSML